MNIVFNLILLVVVYYAVSTVASFFMPQYFGVVGVAAGLLAVYLNTRRFRNQKED